MSELTKQALKVDNNQSFPNNNAGLITPSALRTFNENMIDSLVDEIGYTADSGSWNQQIDALEQFTASAVGLNTGSLLVTASAVDNVMTFTKGDSSTFNVTVGSVIPTGTISGSSQITALGFVSSSITGSSLVTASFAAQTLTFTKGDGAQFSLFIPDNSGSVLPSGVVSSSQQITELGFQTTASFNTYTSSNDSKVNSLINATSSYATSAITASSLITASFSGNTLTFTKGDSSTFGIVIPDVSGSVLPSGLVSGSSQIILQDTTGNLSGSRIDGLVTSASFAISSSHSEFSDNATSASYALSASHAELADNSTFSIYADNTIVYGKNLHSTTIPKGTPLYFTGSGTAGNLVGILPADAGNPLRMPAGGIAGESIIVGEEGIVILDGFINEVDTTAFQPGDDVFVGVGGGYTNVIPTGSNNLIQFLGYVEKSAVNGSGVIQMTGEARGLPNLQSGYAWVGDVNDVPQAIPTSSFGTPINTGSFATTGSNTFVGNQVISGSTTITGELSVTPALLPNSAPGGLGQFIIPFLSGSTNVIARDSDNALYWQPAFNVLAVSASTGNVTTSPTGMTVTSNTTGSTQITTTRLVSNFGAGRNIAIAGDAEGTALTGLTGITNPSIILQSGSAGLPPQYYAPIQFQASQSFTDGRVTFTRNVAMLENIEITGSLTASLQQGYVWVGDVNGRTTTVATSSFGGGSTDTGSLMVTGSVAGNVLTFTKGDASTFVLTVDTGSGGGGAAFPFTGSAEITGSLGITGSMSGFVNTLSVASSTASVNFNDGNMFTLTLPTGSTTHITPSNIRRGQTINIQISQASGASTGSVSFSPNVLFAGGNDYQVTATGSAIDLLTFVSLDGTNVLGTSIKNFL
jgi:hypothetical protein